MTVSDGLTAVMQRVGTACDKAGRAASDVTVVAVAKTFSADRVAEAIEAGATDIGENRAQELKEKATVLGDRARWHFIGPLQTNKVRQVVGVATLIHSVDRFGLAEAIGRRARSLGIVQDVLIEVNIAGEASKTGVEPARAAAFAREVSALGGIRVRGLMAIPPLESDPESMRPHFAGLAALGGEVSAVVPGAAELSMGMSADFEVAIEEGATLIRVGRAIFGPRSR